VLVAAFTGRMEELYQSILDGPREAIDPLVIGLVGGMVFFLGLMNVAREGGLLAWLARRLGPVMRRLFPDVPADHPAMSSMILNIAANVLGLGNAATPFGVKAMTELRTLNPRPGVASDSMSLFLAINTSSVTLMPPLGTLLVREAAGSADPLAFWIPTLIATSTATVAALGACLLLRRLWPAPPAAAGPQDEEETPPSPPVPPAPEIPLEPPAPPHPVRRLLVWAALGALAVALSLEIARVAGDPATGFRTLLRAWLLPLLVAGLLLVGLSGRVKVYEAAVAGGREGLDLVVRIAPFLVIILAAVAMFRASGALDLLIGGLDPLTSRVGLPAEALPMALLRPLSGSGAFGVMSEILQSQGPDSFVGLLVSTFQGSTETTFYVLAVYFGAARVRAGRYTLAACLAGDVAGIAAATAACHAFFGGP